MLLLLEVDDAHPFLEKTTLERAIIGRDKLVLGNLNDCVINVLGLGTRDDF